MSLNLFQSRGSGSYVLHSEQAIGSVSFARTGLLDTVFANATFSGTTVTTSVVHGLSVNSEVRFTGQLPPELSISTRYYVTRVVNSRAFEVSATLGGTSITFSAVTNDVLLVRNPAGVGVNDVLLRQVSGAVWKTTNFAVSGVRSTFGWFRFLAAPNTIQVLSLTVTESLVIAQSVVAHIPFVHVTATETLSTADAAGRTQNLFRALTDATAANFIISDAPVATLPKLRSAAELLTISDSPVAHRGPGAFATEALSTSDATTRQLALFRFVLEALLTADVATEVRTLIRIATAAEFLATFDLATQNAIYLRSVLEFLSTSDTATANIGGFVFNLTASEALATADSAGRILNALRATNESLSTADTASFHILTSARFAVESLVIADSVFGLRGRAASATELLSVAMSLSAAGVWQRSPVESLLISDAPARVAAFRRTTKELLSLIVAATGRSHFDVSAAELLAIYQYAAWITGPHDPWEYWLDLRTGNLPVESTLDTPDAESIASTPEAESGLEAPDAESDLVGNVASGDFRYVDP